MSEWLWVYVSSNSRSPERLSSVIAEHYRDRGMQHGTLILNLPRMFVVRRRTLVQVFVREDLVGK